MSLTQRATRVGSVRTPQRTRVLAFGASVITALACGLAGVAAAQDSPHGRSALRAAMQQVRDHVASLPDEEQGRWRSRLPLEQDSGNAAEDDASLDAFMLLARRLHGLEQGLEAPPLLEARSLLRREITRLLADEHRPEPGDLTSHEEADAEALQEFAAWLDAQDQLQPQDIAAIRKRLPHPTVILHFDRSLFAEQLQAFRESSDQTQNSSNCIAGAHVTGPSIVHVDVTASLPPCREEAKVVLKIQGGLDSPANVARKGKVRIFSSAETQFTGEKIVHWKHGRVVAEPAQLTAATQAHLRGVSAPILQRFRRLHGAIENFAWKKAHQTRTQAECESARLAEQQVGAEIDRQVESKIEQINQKLNEHLLTPLDRLGVGVQISSASGATHAGVGLLVHDDDLMLGAPRPPRDTTVDGKIQVSVHESMIGKLTRRNAGGVWWSDRDFADFQKELVGEYSHHFRLGPHFPTWSIQFDWRRPLTTRILDDHVAFHLRGRAVQIDGVRRQNPFHIVARYSLAMTHYGVQFRRRGDVQVEADQLDADARSLLGEKFGDLFGEEVFLDGLMPPAGGAFETLARFESRHLRLESQWVTLAFESVEEVGEER